VVVVVVLCVRVGEGEARRPGGREGGTGGSVSRSEHSSNSTRLFDGLVTDALSPSTSLLSPHQLLPCIVLPPQPPLDYSSNNPLSWHD